MKSKINMAKIICAGCVVSLLSVCSATTYYKVGSDGTGNSSFSGNVGKDGSTCGWSNVPGATKTAAIPDFSTSDFVVAGKSLRLPATNPAITFSGKSLTLTDVGEISLKSSSTGVSRDVTINDLRVDGSGKISYAMTGTEFNLKGAITLLPSSSIIFYCTLPGGTTTDNRSVVVDSAVTGDETTSINFGGKATTSGGAKQKMSLTLNNVGSFKGTIGVDGVPYHTFLTVNGAYGGTLTDLPADTLGAWFDFDGLPAETGLRIATTTPSSVLKTNLHFFSPTNDFYAGGQKVLTFPAGAEVDLADFDLSFSTSPDGTLSPFYLEQVTNTDQTISFVTKAGRTFYKIGKDGADKSSFVTNQSSTVGWAVTASAKNTTPFSAMEMRASDFIVNEGTTLRTPIKGSSLTFAGHTLKLIGTGIMSSCLLLKSVNGATITIPKLIVDNALISNGSNGFTFTLAGDFAIETGSSANFSCADGSNTRGLIVTAVLHGDETTRIRLMSNNAGGTAQHTFSELGDFFGIIVDEAENAKSSTITIPGAFSGQLGALCTKSVLKVNYEGLPAGTGLRATTVSESLKTKLTLFGETTDFAVDNLPLLRFPAGTVVDPSEFSIAVATTVDGPTTPITTLKTYVDENDNNAVVLAVNTALPTFAKLKDDGTGTFAWHFYGADWNEVTESCDLTEPNEEILVCFDSSAEFEAIKARSCTAAGYHMTGLAVTDDVDLTSIGCAITREAGLTIDLAGHKMTVPTSFFDDAATVTDSAGGGELHVNVPFGTTVNNTEIELAGQLKFVKEGDGVFAAKRKGQSYSGGTEIRAGKLMTAAGDGTDRTYSALNHLVGAEGSDIWVGPGASFDIAGNYDYYLHHIILAGGTLRSSSASDGPITQTKSSYGGLGWISLTTNSTLVLRSDTVFSGKDETPIDLGGQTLAVDAHYNAKTMFWQKDITNGTVHLVGTPTAAVEFRVMSRTVEARTVDFIDGVGFNMQTNMNVRGYNPVFERDNTMCTGTAALNVYGTFRPDSDYFYGCTLQDGATLDLSGKTNVWSTTSSATKGLRTVTFADNATIYVDLGNRRPKNNELIVAWNEETKPVNLSTLKFKAASGQKYGMIKTEHGVYAVCGMQLIIR